MNKKSDYETFFDEIGLDSPQERETVLNYVRELFGIAINHLSEMDKMEVAYD